VGLEEHGAVPRIQQRQHDVHKRLVGTCTGTHRRQAMPERPRSPLVAGMQHPGSHAGRLTKQSGAQTAVMGRAALGRHTPTLHYTLASTRVGPRATSGDQHPAATGRASTSAAAHGQYAASRGSAAQAAAPAVTMTSCPGSPFSAASLACSAATCARIAGRVRRSCARLYGIHGAWQPGTLPHVAEFNRG